MDHPPPDYHTATVAGEQQAPHLPPRHDTASTLAAPPALPPRPTTPVTAEGTLIQSQDSAVAELQTAAQNESLSQSSNEFSKDDDATVEIGGQSYLATMAFLIPFPEYDSSILKPKAMEKVPPFALYSPLHPRLSKPADGEKESLVHKAQRHWQKEEESAAHGDGLKNKAIRLIGKGMDATKNSGIEFLIRTPEKKQLKELHVLYPSTLSNEQLKEDFIKFVEATKKGAIKSSAMATALVPCAAVFDTVTFIPGPFEIAATWAASSWIGTKRATAISNGITSDSVSLKFTSNTTLFAFQYRLHELAWQKASKGLVPAPKWQGEGHPRRGAELADTLFKVLQDLNCRESSYDTDRVRVGEDLEKQMDKAASEFVKAISKE